MIRCDTLGLSADFAGLRRGAAGIRPGMTQRRSFRRSTAFATLRMRTIPIDPIMPQRLPFRQTAPITGAGFLTGRIPEDVPQGLPLRNGTNRAIFRLGTSRPDPGMTQCHAIREPTDLAAPGRITIRRRPAVPKRNTLFTAPAANRRFGTTPAHEIVTQRFPLSSPTESAPLRPVTGGLHPSMVLGLALDEATDRAGIGVLAGHAGPGMPQSRTSACRLATAGSLRSENQHGYSKNDCGDADDHRCEAANAASMMRMRSVTAMAAITPTAYGPSGWGHVAAVEPARAAMAAESTGTSSVTATGAASVTATGTSSVTAASSVTSRTWHNTFLLVFSYHIMDLLPQYEQNRIFLPCTPIAAHLLSYLLTPQNPGCTRFFRPRPPT